MEKYHLHVINGMENSTEQERKPTQQALQQRRPKRIWSNNVNGKYDDR